MPAGRIPAGRYRPTGFGPRQHPRPGELSNIPHPGDLQHAPHKAQIPLSYHVFTPRPSGDQGTVVASSARLTSVHVHAGCVVPHEGEIPRDKDRARRSASAGKGADPHHSGGGPPVSRRRRGSPGQECDLVCRTRPDVVIVSQPEEGAALGALKRITDTPIPPAALLLADRLTGDGVRRLLRLRAAGILHRATAGRHLQWAVHAAAHGGLALERGLARDLADAPTEPTGAGGRGRGASQGTGAARRAFTARTRGHRTRRRRHVEPGDR